MGYHGFHVYLGGGGVSKTTASPIPWYVMAATCEHHGDRAYDCIAVETAVHKKPYKDDSP